MKYQKAFTAMNELFAFCKQPNSMGLLEYLQPNIRYRTSFEAMKKISADLFKIDNAQTRLNKLVVLTEKYSQAMEESKFAYIIEDLHQRACGNFFGKTSFRSNDPIRQFIYKAHFHLMSDGRIAIDNLSDNYFYREYFARGKPLHNEFEPKLKKIFGTFTYIKTESSCDYYQKIIFDSKTSKILTDCFGLGAREMLKEAKQRIYSQKTFLSLFLPKSMEDQTREASMRSLLPAEIIQHICSFI
jgi:hypothetical protein